VKEHVEPMSALYSDALKSYDGLSEDFAHQVIDHAVAYVDGQVHTNNCENFWSLLKRGINGTYVSVNQNCRPSGSSEVRETENLFPKASEKK
jgi:transposase-like protein